MRTKQGAAVALAVVAALGLAACGGTTAQEAGVAAQPQQATTQPAETATAPGATATEVVGGLNAQDVFGTVATGAVVANQDVELVFQVQGTVGRVLVDEGDVVKQGDVLAELDVRSFDQRIRDAEAALVSSRADVAALTEDPTSSEAAAAQAAIQQAQGQLASTQGAVTAQDIAAAQAQLQQAEANLADVLAGPKQEEVRQETARRDAAVAQLEQTRNSLSQAKTQAEIALQQATVTLEQAQTRYSEAYWQWEYARNRDSQPSDVEQGPEPNLSDVGQQKAYNAYKQAELDLQNAQQALDAAAKRVEEARQAEIDGIEIGTRNIEAAQASLDILVRPADAANVAQAQAQVADAQANIERLQGGNRAGQLAAASAAVAAAQAQYEQLFDDPTASALARAEAGVARAEASLAEAQLNREYAEIRAPFAGEIAVRNIDPGDTGPTSTAGGTGALRLVDTSAVYVEVQVSDADIANIELGQKANVTADALPGEQFTGTVDFISPTATVNQTVTTYLVKVQLDQENTPLRIGMSVTADFQTDGQ